MGLAEAIEEHRLITFNYDGLPRIVQPATYGLTTTGKLSLRGCLIDGSSRRNEIPCWELYTEAKITDLVVTSDEFVAFDLDGYTRGDSAFIDIIAEH